MLSFNFQTMVLFCKSTQCPFKGRIKDTFIASYVMLIYTHRIPNCYRAEALLMLGSTGSCSENEKVICYSASLRCCVCISRNEHSLYFTSFLQQHETMYLFHPYKVSDRLQIFNIHQFPSI